MRRLFIAAMLVLGPAEYAAAQGPLDILPEDAAISLAIRNLDELIKRGDKFLADTQIEIGMRPSKLFEEANRHLGIKEGLNTKGSAAIFLMRPEKEKERLGLSSFEALIVPAIPFSDADAMADNFGIEKGKLQPKGIFPTFRNDFGKFASRANTTDHFYLSNSEKTLQRLNQSKPVSAALTPAQRKRFNESDILLHFGRYLWASEHENFAKVFADTLKAGDEPEDKIFAAVFAESLKEVQNAVVGFRLDDGIDAHFLATVAKDGQAAGFLKMMSDKRKPSSLQALPEGKVLLAQASSGDAGQQALLAKALFRFMLEDLLVRQQIVAGIDRLNYLAIFHEVWRQLEGNRFAVYQNADEKKLGLFSAVAILDTADAPLFLRDMKTLSKMAIADTLDLTRKDIRGEIDMDRLVKNLGSNVYAVRQSANTRLALIGEPALPYLSKAIDSKGLDLETLTRARALHERINAVATGRRKELLSETKGPLFLRPKLTFIANVEKRQGLSIDAINIKIAGLEKLVTHQYTQLLGPDWDKVRLAVVGKQVVVLLGSDLSLFDAAIRNVQTGNAGLAAAKQLSAFHDRAAKERIFELHLSVDGALRLINPKAAHNTPLQLTSVSMTLGPQFLQVDARVPTPEARAIAKKAQEMPDEKKKVDD